MIRNFFLYVFELIKMVVIALVIIIPIRYFLIQPFYVKGASMEPNFFDHEYLIIDELSYRLGDPKRGDVVVFRYPNDPKEYFLKRIIGLPGERVKVSEGEIVVYNDAHPEGFVIKESYIPSDVTTEGEKIMSLSNNQYYVMGDNRPNSFDSRRFGPVDENLIVGRTWLRGWPLNRIQIFETPTY